MAKHVGLKARSDNNFGGVTVAGYVFRHYHKLTLRAISNNGLRSVIVDGVAVHSVIGTPVFLQLKTQVHDPRKAPINAVGHVLVDRIGMFGTSSHCSSVVDKVPKTLVRSIALDSVRVCRRKKCARTSKLLAPPRRRGMCPRP